MLTESDVLSISHSGTTGPGSLERVLLDFSAPLGYNGGVLLEIGSPRV